MKTFKEFIAEAKKLTAKDLVAMFKNEADWGTEIKQQTRVTRDGNLEVINSYWADGKKALKDLIDDWTGSTGTYTKYFNTEHGVKFTLVNSYMHTTAEESWHKKFTKNGVVGVILKVS